MFLDRAQVVAQAGDGGRGMISFRREAHVPRGGPDGGDGGNGGSVVLRVDPQMSTLSEFRFRKALKATSGAPGTGKRRHGKAGSDLIVRVPPGTLVKDKLTGETLADLTTRDEEIIVARGGKGGRGNTRFVSSTQRVPRLAEDGQPGQKRELELELKLIADVGLAGLPNAGKSTLLAALTRATPKIAAYPFTTLTPNLGVARLEDRELVVADVPGLIEGAHLGAGLGEEFLRHLERTRVLVHVLDTSTADPTADRKIVEAELAAYGEGVAELPRLVALNKMDLPEARAQAEGLDGIRISAASGEGVDLLMKEIFRLVDSIVKTQVEADGEKQITPRRIAFAESGREWSAERDGDAFVIKGDRLERLAAGLDWNSPEASAYFHRLLNRTGVERKLRSLGAKDGDTVRIGKIELEWRDAP